MNEKRNGLMDGCVQRSNGEAYSVPSFPYQPFVSASCAGMGKEDNFV